MAYKRKRNQKARPKKRQRTMNISGRARRARRTQPQVSVKRTSYVGAWTFGTANTNDFWRYQTYTMFNFNNFSEFSNVFDEYKLNAIKVTYRPRYDNIAVSLTGSVQPQAVAHVVVDPASTTLPGGVYNSGSLNTFMENSGVRTRLLNKAVSVYFRPKVADQVNGSGSIARMVKPGWIKTTEPNVDFRGFHMYLQQNNFSAANTNIVLDTYVTFYVQFRNLK